MYKSGLVELEAVVAIARLGSFRAAAVVPSGVWLELKVA
jgi:hypothetical protein